MHLQVKTELNLGLAANVTLTVAQCPPYHMTCAFANVEVVASIGLEEDAFTRKYYYLTFDLGRMKCCLVFYASRDVCTCKV